MLDYRKLQNGSDIRGIALGGVPGEDINLGAIEAFRLSRGFVLFLSEKIKKNPEDIIISIGHDSRITGESLKEAIIEALISVGVKVLDAGLSSTPSMFMSTVFKEYNADGAIMITASHLPYNRNGFKYFDKNGGLDKKDISTIISYAESEIVEMGFDFVSGPDKKTVDEIDLIGTYSDFLKEKIKTEINDKENYDKPLSGLKIVVDAGNGASGFYANRILKELGADIEGSRFLNPDGMFPNHEPNPENKEAMRSIREAVLESKADLGIIFDTDGDRASSVDQNGKEINRNAIVAMAAALIADKNPGTTVVTDSITSDELTEYLEKSLKLKHLRYKRGYKNVINKAIELNEAGTDSALAIETSGHAAYKENFFLDDGAYLATKIVIKLALLRKEGKSIDMMISELREPKEATEKRIPITGDGFKEKGDIILKELKTWAEENRENGIEIVEPNYEGVRLNFRKEGLKGWALLRKSLHDPLLPLNIEVTEGETEDIYSILKTFLSRYKELKLEE